MVLAACNQQAMHNSEIEAILLSLCAQGPPACGAMPGRNIDVTEVMKLADLHGVGSMVRHRLVSDSGLPGGREHATRRTLVFTADLNRILDLLRQANLPVIPLRGPVLGHLLYGDAAAREYSDLDILVRREDFARAREVLLANFCTLQSPDKITQDCAFRWGSEVSLRSPSGTAIDVHWELGPAYYPYALPVETIWNGLQTIPFEQRPTPFLRPECLLLSLCIHGAKHHWERLMWLCDVARLTTRVPIDWNAAWMKAAELGCEPPLLLGLYLAHHLLEAEVPDMLLERARRSASIQTLARQVRERMFAGDPRPYTALESCRFHFRLAGFRGGLRFALGVLLIPTDADWTWVRLPAPLYWLYYPVRVGRLTFKHSAGVIGRLSSRFR